MFYAETQRNNLIGEIVIIAVCKNCYRTNGRMIENLVSIGSDLESFLTTQLGDGGKDWVKTGLNISYNAKKSDWECFEEEKDEVDEKIDALWNTPTTQDDRDKGWNVAKNTKSHKDFVNWANK